MPDEVITADSPVPATLPEYEQWEKAQAAKETDKPAVVEAQAETAKTEPNSEAEEDQEHEEEADTPAKKSGFARRIDKLNQKIGAKEARIAELERIVQGGNATRTEEKPAVAAAPLGKPVAANFESYEEYIESLTDWKLAQAEAFRAKNAEVQKAAETQRLQLKAWNEKVTEAKAELPDYADVIAAADDIRVSPAMQEAILTSDYGPALQYHLAKNPSEAERIYALSPIATAREIGKIEAAIASGKATPETKTRVVSKAPAPPKTVKAQSESAEPDPTDFRAWEKWRNAQPGARLNG